MMESFAPCRPSVSSAVQEEAREGMCTIPIPESEAQPPGELQRNPPYPPRELDIWNVILSFKNSFALLIQYLQVKLGVTVQSHSVGSFLVRVTCSSLEILEGLWKDYCSGHLNEVVQETLVTTEVLETLGLSELKLKTIIFEEEYNACKEFFMQNSGTC